MMEALSLIFFRMIEISLAFAFACERFDPSSRFIETSLNKDADLKARGIVAERRIAEITRRSLVEIDILNGRRIKPFNIAMSIELCL
jgi:hypothetical protein